MTKNALSVLCWIDNVVVHYEKLVSVLSGAGILPALNPSECHLVRVLLVGVKDPKTQ